MHFGRHESLPIMPVLRANATLGSLPPRAAAGCSLFGSALSTSVPTSREPIVKGLPLYVFFVFVHVFLCPLTGISLIAVYLPGVRRRHF